MIGEKEDEENIARFILDQNLIGRLGARARRLVLGNPDFKRDDRIERSIGDLGPVAAVDRGSGQVEQEIRHACGVRAIGQQPVEELCCFGPDARQVCGVCEEWVEDGRTHRALLVLFRRQAGALAMAGACYNVPPQAAFPGRPAGAESSRAQSLNHVWRASENFGA